MIDNTVLTNWIAKKRDDSVSVVLAGRIFGGRYGESPQEPKSYEYVNNTLTIKFGTTEVLEIVEPESALIGSHNELIISRAKSALWGWHYYGRKQTPENWCTESYVLNNDNIVHLKVTGFHLTFRHMKPFYIVVINLFSLFKPNPSLKRDAAKRRPLALR